MNKILLLSLYILLLMGSCAKSVENEVAIYSNDFETDDLVNISNGKIVTFNGNKVLGNYNNDQFNLLLDDLPEHVLIDVSFDLYIHDSWEGNQQFNDYENGPDIWQFKVDNKTYISTTFSNIDCSPGNFCAPQAYPSDYPNNNNNPKSGAINRDLPGFCRYVNKPNGSTLYQIHKSISHSDKRLLIQCLDQLKQSNVTDKLCDESWSVDNIIIKVINLD